MTTDLTGTAPGATLESLGDLTLRELFDRLASSRPVPGGGSASAVVGGIAASLVSMVAELSAGYAAEHGTEPTRAAGVESGRRLAARLMTIADADSAAFAGFGSAMRMPRTTDEERVARTRAIREAARSAAGAPLECMEACLAVARSAEALAGRSNPNLASDLVVASVLAEAAARGAAANVAVNVPLVKDPDWAVATERRATILQSGIDLLGASTRYIIGAGVERGPAGDPTAPGGAGGGPVGIDPREVEA
jgi:formiminotetrahydrofolate cyclodeaminase